MFQITAEISALTTEQREAFAAFILAFPQASPRNIHTPEIIEDEEPVIIPSFSAHVDEDADEQSPETAFAPSNVVSNISVAGPVLVEESRLDKNGLPWDERIHSSSRVKTADGSWRQKRGVDDALVATVESELKALMGIPSPPPVAAVPPPPVPAPAAPAVAEAPTRQAFVSLISKASAAIQAKKLTQDELTSAVVAAGVPSLPLLANRLDLVPQVESTIDAYMVGR
jgi:hypothetical protein